MTKPKGAADTGWTLCVPFIGSAITFDQEYVETLANTRIEISPSARGYSKILLAGFGSADQARDQFQAVRTALLTASLTTGMGIRINDAVVQLADGAPPPDVDTPFIYKEGHDLRQLVLIPGKTHKQMAKFMPKFREGFEFGISSSSALKAIKNDRVKLAFEIYTDSFFETSDSARFVALVGVLEVLKDKGPTSDGARSLVERWIQETSTLEAEEANSFRSRLAWLKEISIAQGIASVVTRHLGEDRGREAKSLYGRRSTLVHAGERLLDPTSAVRLQAEQLVMDLLADILMCGSL